MTEPTLGDGLRERKKQATREALSAAALRLAVQRGLDNLRVEEIAAEAGVSARTFNNYFASKAEAVASRHLDRARRIAAALRARPPAEPLWAAITAATLEQVGGGDRAPDREWTAGVRLMTRERALYGEFLKANDQAERELATAVAERTGTRPDRDLYPRLVAAAVGAALRVAVVQWLRADPPVPLTPLLREALAQIGAGLPDPTPVVAEEGRR